MSPIVARPLPPAVELRAERIARASARRTLAERLADWKEPALVFGVAYLVYAAVGLYATLELGLVVGDAESRLAHAYFVWWDEPSKLSAIGFYWPPLQTLVLLPLAAIPPLATSLAALPLTSALFGAGTVVVVDRAFAGCGVRRVLRWPIVAAAGLNPLLLYYAVNGMSESLYLFLLALAVWLFVRWTLSPRWPDMLLIGTVLALGMLARYEVALALLPIAACMVYVLLRRREHVARIEASVLSLVVPVLYALAVWLFLNAAIAGDALAFLRAGAPPDLPPDPAFDDALGLLADAVRAQTAIFPLTLVATALLLAFAIRRRSVVALTLAALTLMNAATTFALLLAAHQGYLLELRYNMRAMPVALIACAWLLATTSARTRTAAAIALAAALVTSNVVTGRTMLVHDERLAERITGSARTRPASGAAGFVKALLLNAGAVKEAPPVGTGVDLGSERAMARFIRTHTSERRNAILADDSGTFGVMLFDGRPARYFDRIGVGDRRWQSVLANPRGDVEYVLAQLHPNRPDLVALHYPGLAAGRPPPFLRLVRREGSFALYRVSR